MVTITHDAPPVTVRALEELPPGAGLFIGGALSLALWIVIAAIVVVL
jgi:hypothetical protein